MLVGVLLGPLSSVLSVVTTAERRRRARRLLLASVDEVVQRYVVVLITAELDRARAVSAALRIAQ